ncbi:MAG TPA: class I SAM-dependent methyltransferase [Rhizobiales bacterium]|nr:class I SAM-dependent methyltransferase [Hyphomicrobiales bacterium]
MQNAENFWDKIAAKYAKSPIADMDAYSYTLERTRSYLSPEDSVLEVGCGTGSTALLLAGDVRQITASDLSGNMIEAGSEKARDQGISNVKFVRAELFGSAIDNGPYDAVFALNVLHLLEDTPAAIGRINGLLKPGGTFISKTVCLQGSGAPFKFRIIKMILPLMQLIGKAPYVNFMKITELEEIISSGGFKIIETGNFPASPPSRYIVARKM